MIIYKVRTHLAGKNITVVSLEEISQAEIESQILVTLALIFR